MRRPLRILALAAALAALPSAAGAAPRCKLEFADNLPFGTYVPVSGAPADQIVSMSYSCTNTPGPLMTLGPGLHFSGGARALQRTGGTDLLRYDVYVDASRTIPFDLDYVYDASPLKKQTITLYGRIPANQLVASGSYTDSMILTIIF